MAVTANVDSLDLEKQTNYDVAQHLRKYIEKVETENFKKLLKKVKDFIDSKSQTKSSILNVIKNKNALNLKSILTMNLDTKNRDYYLMAYSRLLAFAITYGNLEIVKTLINDYGDDINPKGHQSLLAIAVSFKPRILSICSKQEYINLLTFLLEKGSKLRNDVDSVFNENILISILYQTNFKEKIRQANNTSRHLEQHDEINMDLIKFFIDADSNDKYQFKYDWKKFDKRHCMALHCVASNNLEIFKYLLNAKNVFGMKRLSWNTNVPPTIELGERSCGKKCRTLFQYCVSIMGHDKRDRKIAVEFWDILFNDIFEGKKSVKKEILSGRTYDGLTTAHLILQNASHCPELVDRLMSLGFDPNGAEYRGFIIKHVTPCVEAMKIVLNENGKYKNTFDLVCVCCVCLLSVCFKYLLKLVVDWIELTFCLS